MLRTACGSAHARGSMTDDAIDARDHHAVSLADGRQLAFASFGDAHGSPVFYLHGALSSRLEAEVLDAAARSAGVRLIGVDRPGIGASTPHRGRSHASFAHDL